MPAISVQGLRKSYGEYEALRGIDFSVEHGEVFSILGPNGAGKTTTLEILEGFRKRSAGEVDVLGVDPADGGRPWRRRIGIVLQQTAVEEYLTVRGAIQRHAGYYEKPRPVAEVIDIVGLNEKANARIRTLSGGQQRRLDVAIGIVGNPELLFLDEPTTGFDPSARRGAWTLVHNLTGGGMTVVLTTHYMDEAQNLSDRVAVLAGGRIVAQGTPETIGGRQTAAVRIRFRLPEGVAVGDLPVTALVDENGTVEFSTDDELHVLHELTGWALERNVKLEGLAVERPSLEDVYLALTAGEGGTP